MTDLTSRLREPIMADAFENGLIKCGLLTERLVRERGDAADEIDRLTGEVGRLEADRNDWKETAEDGRREYQEEHKFWRERNGVLKTKADALAEAVRGYINGKCIDPEAMEAALTAYQEQEESDA